MFNQTFKPLLLALVLTSFSARAGDVTVSKCSWKIANALNRLEVKGAAPLEITEFHLIKSVDPIFGSRKLELVPMKNTLKEKATIYRNPTIGRAILKGAFEETRFISDLPSEDFASLLKPNTVYTYTIQDKKITFAQTRPGVIRDFASKHAILSADKDAGPLRMAGEMWIDEKGILHFDPGSGTYKPGSEDLKRAEIFFKEHMGIKNAVPHYFEAPVVVPAGQKAQAAAGKGLIEKIKDIEKAKLVVSAKGWLLSGTKMNVVSKARMREMEVMENETITLIDPNGKEVKYKIARLETMVKEETFFDTENLDLNNKKQQIRTSKTFKLSEESKIPKRNSLSESENAVRMARKTSIGNAALIPVARTRKETVQLAVYPIDAKGKPGKTAFLISLDTRTTKGLSSSIKDKTTEDYSTSIEDLSTGNKTRESELNQLTDKLQKRFGLEKGTSEKTGTALISSLETPVGQ